MKKSLLLLVFLYLIIPSNGYSQTCSSVPNSISCSSLTTTSVRVNWSTTGITAWDLYIAPSGSNAPTPETTPTYGNVTTKPFTTTQPLTPETQYIVYVRSNCGASFSSWSAGFSFVTLETCPKPTSSTISSIGLNNAALTISSSMNAWEVLLIPSLTAPPTPGAEPGIENGTILLNTTTTTVNLTNLSAGTTYYYYIRSVCGGTVKGGWTVAKSFATLGCLPEQKCNYRFLLSDTGLSGWDGATMEVRQGEAVIATLGGTLFTTGNTSEINVMLCDGLPFTLYWSNPGVVPSEVGIQILNSANDIIYSKTPGIGNPLEVLYSGTGNCNTPSCSKPTFATTYSTAITTSSATLTWNPGTATQWEVYVAPVNAPFPVNGTPLNTNNASYHLVDTNSVNLTGLLPATAYSLYVRSICSSTEISAWTSYIPKRFTTLSLYDECQDAQNVPVNTGPGCAQYLVSTTLGGTVSANPGSCTGIGGDVWFSFTPTNPTLKITFSDIVASAYGTQLQHALYAGSCGTLTPLYCSTTPYSFANNLVIGATYYIRVFTNIAEQSASFKLCITTPPALTNDNCATAKAIPINSDAVCNSVGYGSLTGATPSGLTNNCSGTPDDDVWFSFVAGTSQQSITFIDINGTSTNLVFNVYSGTCGNLTSIYCGTAANTSTASLNFIPGTTYYIRVWSSEATAQQVNFSICIKAFSSCPLSESLCNSSANAAYYFPNTIFQSGSSSVACLSTAPNPSYATLHVVESGPLVYRIVQSTSFDSFGAPVGNPLDVDFVAWGPFSNPDSCQLIQGSCGNCPNNTTSPSFYPVGNIVDCSYSGNYYETLHIPNAQAGEYYIILITNFSNLPGMIQLAQVNINSPGAGNTNCVDEIQLIAFIDKNNNGTKESNEINFTYGSFTYQKNNSGPVNNVSSPAGRVFIYDNNSLNTYDFSYQINPEFSAYYALTPTSFNDINIESGSGINRYYFPVKLTQGYDDVEVTMISTSSPRPGMSYANKIIYKNLSPTAASGSLTFTKNPLVAINSISQTGTTPIPDGFTYNYSNLLPYETRSIDVVLQVPTITTAPLGTLLTNSATISTMGTDLVASNNSYSNTQTVVGSYDPNDKMEAHGTQIRINEFAQGDYLFYTIRFQNTGSAEAFDVHIEDFLDAKLDETSIRMISASHEYTMDRVENKLTWEFNNIDLPGLAQNEELSKGYVTFKVKLKPGFVAGDVIPNGASIYFDTNPAIETNVFQTQFLTPLSNGDFKTGDFIVYPNPAKGKVSIDLLNSPDEITSVTVYDLTGKAIREIRNVKAKHLTVNISDLAKGTYIIEIYSSSKFREVKRLLIE